MTIDLLNSQYSHAKDTIRLLVNYVNDVKSCEQKLKKLSRNDNQIHIIGQIHIII